MEYIFVHIPPASHYFLPNSNKQLCIIKYSHFEWFWSRGFSSLNRSVVIWNVTTQESVKKYPNMALLKGIPHSGWAVFKLLFF